MNTFILYCPHLERDLRPILAHVPDPMILTGARTEPGEAGCLAMHQRAVRIAQAAGWPYVCVLEDDCGFTPAFDGRQWVATAEWARRAGYGAVHGGSVLVHNPQRVTPTLIAADAACSAHCMIYTDRGYDVVLQAEQPFDLSIGRKGIRPLVALPFVAYQRAGLSGIGRPLEAGDSTTYAGPQHVDYEGLFAMHERALLAGL